MAYSPKNPNGQATMANSEPVVLASDQASIPVTVSGVATSAKQDTIIGHVDGIEGLLTTIDGDTGNISTKIDTIAGAVAGTEMQVDVLTMPTTTVQATNLDIRDLTSASDSVLMYGSDDGGTTKRVIKTDAGGAIQVDLEVASVAVTSIAAGDNNIGNVDIVSMPAITATDLDIRNLTNTDVVTAELSAVDNAVLDAIAASVAAIDTDTTTIIGHVDGIETLIGTTNTTLTTIDGRVDGLEASNSAIQTAVQLIDDTVQVLGTDTFTEATSKGITLGAVRRDADTTLVNTTNEFTPLQVDANGRLKVEAFSGEALPVTLTSTTVTGTVAVTQSGTWDEVGINDSGNSITVDNSTLAVVGGGTEATAMRVTIASDSTGVLSIDDNGSSITVDGTVAVTGVATLAEQQTQTASLSVMDDWDNTASDGASVSGDVAHDGIDAGEPVKIGYKAIAHGANPTAVAANDRTNGYSNRHGIPFTVGGHPNTITKEFTVLDSDGAQTNLALVTVSAGTKIVVTKCGVLANNANTVNVNVRLGFGAATLPAAALAGATGIILSHPAIAPGSGVVEGNGSGIIGIGADDEDLRLTCDDPVTGSIRVMVTYYTIES